MGGGRVPWDSVLPARPSPGAADWGGRREGARVRMLHAAGQATAAAAAPAQHVPAFSDCPAQRLALDRWRGAQAEGSLHAQRRQPCPLSPPLLLCMRDRHASCSAMPHCFGAHGREAVEVMSSKRVAAPPRLARVRRRGMQQQRRRERGEARAWSCPAACSAILPCMLRVNCLACGPPCLRCL